MAFLVRLAFALRYPDPGYPDAYYYVNVARQLAAGAGFNIDFIWTFVDVGGRLPDSPRLPIPSNAHWMPLASIVQVPFIWLLGPQPIASVLPFLIVGSFAAPLTWLIAIEAGAPRWLALGAGVLTAIPALSTVFFSQPDNFGLYQVLAASALLLAARGLKGDPRSFVAAGLCAGLAALSRTDGALLAGVLAVTFLWSRVRERRRWTDSDRVSGPVPIWAGGASLGLFIVVMAPWWIRQLAVFGSLSPSSASGRILWIRSLDEMNSITTDTSLGAFLAQGLGPLVQSRIGGLLAAAGIFAIMAAAVLLLVPMVIGAWRRRRSRDYGPLLLYAAALFAFSALVSAVHVPNGTFIHSAVALLPHAYVLALEGIVVLVGAVARRRPQWQPARAAPVFAASVVGIVAVTGIFFGQEVQVGWDEERAERLAVGRALDQGGVGREERLMAIDAGGYRYFTGRPTIVTPADDLATIERVARAYQVRWLVLERDEIVPALIPVLAGEARPAWVGSPLFVDRDADVLPRIAVFPICVEPADERCGPDYRASAQRDSVHSAIDPR